MFSIQVLVMLIYGRDQQYYTNWTLEISSSFEEDDCLIFNTGVILVIFR